MCVCMCGFMCTFLQFYSCLCHVTSFATACLLLVGRKQKFFLHAPPLNEGCVTLFICVYPYMITWFNALYCIYATCVCTSYRITHLFIWTETAAAGRHWSSNTVARSISLSHGPSCCQIRDSSPKKKNERCFRFYPLISSHDFIIAPCISWSQ